MTDKNAAFIDSLVRKAVSLNFTCRSSLVAEAGASLELGYRFPFPCGKG
ncbi:MAG: hypothetical protein ACYDC3_14930 [Candidatus Binataceae bacterium]